MDTGKRQGNLSSYQLFGLMVNLMVATGIFTIARSVSEVAGRGVAVSVLLAGVLALAQLGGMYLLAKRFPQQTLPEYAPIILGKVLGPVYLLGYSLLHTAVALLVARNFWPLVDAWDFHTPSRVFLSLLILVSWNIARRGLIVLSRVSEIILTLSIPIFLLILLPHSRIDLDQLRPVLDRSAWDLIKGMLPAYFSLAGFDVLLFAYPFSTQKKAMRTGALAVAAVSVLYAGVSVLVITTLGLERTLTLTWPMQTYLNNFAFAVVDRLDVLFLMFWTLQIVMSITIPLFMAGACLRGMMPKLSSHGAANLSLIPLLGAAMLHDGLPAQTAALEIYSYIAIVYIGTLPFLLWLTAVIRGKGGKQGGKDKAQNAA